MYIYICYIRLYYIILYYIIFYIDEFSWSQSLYGQIQVAPKWHAPKLHSNSIWQYSLTLWILLLNTIDARIHLERRSHPKKILANTAKCCSFELQMTFRFWSEAKRASVELLTSPKSVSAAPSPGVVIPNVPSCAKLELPWLRETEHRPKCSPRYRKRKAKTQQVSSKNLRRLFSGTRPTRTTFRLPLSLELHVSSLYIRVQHEKRTANQTHQTLTWHPHLSPNLHCGNANKIRNS